MGIKEINDEYGLIIEKMKAMEEGVIKHSECIKIIKSCEELLHISIIAKKENADLRKSVLSLQRKAVAYLFLNDNMKPSTARWRDIKYLLTGENEGRFKPLKSLDIEGYGLEARYMGRTGIGEWVTGNSNDSFSDLIRKNRHIESVPYENYDKVKHSACSYLDDGSISIDKKTTISGDFGYVLTSDHELILSGYISDFPGGTHHSSLARAEPVFCAGHITIEDGRITKVDNSSGHYKPPERSLEYMLRWIETNKVATKGESIGRVFGFDGSIPFKRLPGELDLTPSLPSTKKTPFPSSFFAQFVKKNKSAIHLSKDGAPKKPRRPPPAPPPSIDIPPSDNGPPVQKL